VNPNAVRRLLADTIVELDDRWTSSTLTRPDLNGDLLVQIGHFAPTMASFQSQRFAIPVTWWVTESNSAASVDVFYDTLSWATESTIYRLNEVPWVKQIEMGDVSSPDELPQFLSAEMVVHVWTAKLPEPDES